MKGVNTNVNTDKLREISWEGFIGFTVKAKDNESNLETHTKFREFCKETSDGNYTLGLKYLLDTIDNDYKYQMLYESILDLQEEVAELKTVKTEEKKQPQEDGMF